MAPEFITQFGTVLNPSPRCAPADDFSRFTNTVIGNLGTHPTPAAVQVARQTITERYKAKYKNPPWYHYASRDYHICTADVYEQALDTLAALEIKPKPPLITPPPEKPKRNIDDELFAAEKNNAGTTGT